MKQWIIVLLFCTQWVAVSFSQKESTWWYFREAAGIQFTQLPPVADTNANDSVWSTGLASGVDMTSISDENGILQFYASFTGVFNREHQRMPNGLFHSSFVGSAAEQGCYILPRPQHFGQYYFFYGRTAFLNTYGDGITGGVFYSLIDMSLDNGLGDVVDTVKKVLLTDSTEEKMSGCPHSNGIDYWYMIRKSGTNNFLAYLVTETGISTSPIVSSLGTVSSNYSLTEGSLGFNHKGNIMVHQVHNFMELYDFDNSTGQLSNLRTISINVGIAPGTEFSPDDSKLYVGGPTQYDLSVPTQSAIQASEVYLGGFQPTQISGLQMGLDGKIYGTGFDGADAYYMNVIHNPNASGFACNYEDSVIYLGGRVGNLMVPQFLSSYFVLNFYTDTVCVGDTARFEMNFTFIDSCLWDFGDPASGSANTDTAIHATHVYDSAGTYTVTLIAQNGVRTDTVIKTITVRDVPQIDLGPDIDFCLAISTADSHKLGLAGETGTYLWNTGSTDSVLWVYSDSVFANGDSLRWLQFTNECGTDRDSVHIYTSEPLSIDLVEDTATCGDSLLLSPTFINANGAARYVWNTGVSSAQLWVKQLDSNSTPFESRTLLVWNSCGSDTAIVTVAFVPQPDAHLPEDQILCSSPPMLLTHTYTPLVSYTWSDGSRVSALRVDSSGTYYLISENQCDTVVDSIDILFIPLQDSLTIDTAICEGSEVALRPAVSSSVPLQGGLVENDFLWDNSSTDSARIVTTTGAYTVTITIEGCTMVQTFNLTQAERCLEVCVPFVPNVCTPNNDGINDDFVVLLHCDFTDFTLSVFNRWGQLLHSESVGEPSVTSSDHAEGVIVSRTTVPIATWDATINNEPASEGVHYYVVTFKDNQGVRQEFKGSFSVLRN